MSNNTKLAISFVDEERRRIYLTIDGCPVTVNCTREDNSDVGDTVKHILIGFMLDGQKEPPKFDNKRKM